MLPKNYKKSFYFPLFIIGLLEVIAQSTLMLMTKSISGVCWTIFWFIYLVVATYLLIRTRNQTKTEQIDRFVCFFKGHKWINQDHEIYSAPGKKGVIISSLHKCERCKKEEFKGMGLML